MTHPGELACLLSKFFTHELAAFVAVNMYFRKSLNLDDLFFMARYVLNFSVIAIINILTRQETFGQSESQLM